MNFWQQLWHNCMFGYSLCILFCLLGFFVWDAIDTMFFGLCLYHRTAFGDIGSSIQEIIKHSFHSFIRQVLKIYNYLFYVKTFQDQNFNYSVCKGNLQQSHDGNLHLSVKWEIRELLVLHQEVLEYVFKVAPVRNS